MSGNTASNTGLTGGALIRRLGRFLRPHRAMVLIAFGCALVGVVASLLVPILIGEAIDCLVGPGQVAWDRLWTIVAVMAGAVAVVVVCRWIQGYATGRLSYETVRDLRDSAFEKIDRLPIPWLDAHGDGDLISRIVNDADAVGQGLLQGLQQLLSGVVTIVGTLVFMVFISAPITLVVVVLTPLSVLVAWAIAHFTSATFRDQQAIQGELTAYVEEAYGQASLIKAFGKGSAERGGFDAIDRRLHGTAEKASFASSLTNPGTRFVNNVIYAVVACVGCFAAVTGLPGPLTIGGVQSFLSYATQYTKPFNEITGTLTEVQAAMASAERIFSLLDAPEMAPEPPDLPRLSTPVRGELDFSHVAFGYDPGHLVLKDVDFHADAGQSIAVVGPTGCGKTTLINLLMGFYHPEAGTISVDGQDIASVTVASLREAFGMVLQDTWLMEGTVAENIAYGRPSASREEVVAAAKAAHAHKFIVQLPQGYDTPVGQGAQALSQGQCQLLCIARVMLRDPSVLVLDEATSSIDTRTEAQVQEAFDAMVQGRTSLIVAHRLSTVRNADKILVLGEGTIQEEGTHEELLAAGGFYSRLYMSQWADEEAQEEALEP